MHSHCFTYSLMNSFIVGDQGAPGAEGGLRDVIQDFHSTAADDLDSSNDSLWERVLKIIADRNVRSSGS